MLRAFTLAREAADRGDKPFGSVLVKDDTVVMSASNREVTENDIRCYPELQLAVRAAQELSSEERSDTVMYTTTEPCLMCTDGIDTVGLGKIIYSVSMDEMEDFIGESTTVSAADILQDDTLVHGPLLNETGRTVHQRYDW